MDIKKLDDVDQRILALLVKNSNMPYAELARLLDLSRAAVTKRINTLIEEGVISRFTINVDPKKLGLDIAVFFEISSLPAKTRDILQELLAYPEVAEVFITGTASLFAFAYFTDTQHLNEFMMRCLGPINGVQQIKTNVLLDSYSGKSVRSRNQHSRLIIKEGFTMKAAKIKPKPMTLTDVLILAAVALIGALLSAFVINPIVRSLQISDYFLSAWPSALYLFSIVLGGILIRKPGAGFLTAVVYCLCMLLLGRATQWATWTSILSNGIGVEIGLAIFAYKRSLIVTMVTSGLTSLASFLMTILISGIMAGVFSDLISIWVNSPFDDILFLTNAFVAAAVVCGLVAWGLLLALEKAGIHKLGLKPKPDTPVPPVKE